MLGAFLPAAAFTGAGEEAPETGKILNGKTEPPPV
jgi:hypothetical protein